MPNMARNIFVNLQKKSRIQPLPKLLNAHKTASSAISSSNHWNCLRQGLLQRNDVKDIITYNEKDHHKRWSWFPLPNNLIPNMRFSENPLVFLNRCYVYYSTCSWLFKWPDYTFNFFRVKKVYYATLFVWT